MTKMKRLLSVFLLLSCCAWAGGPQTAVTFNDIQGTVGIANGGTGNTASSAALAGLGGFPISASQTSVVASGTTQKIVKSAIISGVTNAAEGGQVTIAHGLTMANFISVTYLVDVGTAVFPPEFSFYPEYQYSAYTDANNVVISNHATNSGNVIGKPFRVVICYATN